MTGGMVSYVGMVSTVLPHAENGFEMTVMVMAAVMAAVVTAAEAAVVLVKNFFQRRWRRFFGQQRPQPETTSIERPMMIDQEVQVNVMFNVQYGTLTVPELRTECGKRGLINSGLRGELMNRLARDDSTLGPRQTGLQTGPAVNNAVNNAVNALERFQAAWDNLRLCSGRGSPRSSQQQPASRPS